MDGKDRLMEGNDIPGPYERFLELPVSLVLALLWFIGVMLEVSCVLVLYVTGFALF
jgi:hypothetical protein